MDVFFLLSHNSTKHVVFRGCFCVVQNSNLVTCDNRTEPRGINPDVLDNKKNQRVLGQSRNEIFHDGICKITITENMAFVHIESGGS